MRKRNSRRLPLKEGVCVARDQVTDYCIVRHDPNVFEVGLEDNETRILSRIWIGTPMCCLSIVVRRRIEPLRDAVSRLFFTVSRARAKPADRLARTQSFNKAG